MNNDIDVGYTFLPISGDEMVHQYLKKTPEESITIPDRTFTVVPDAEVSDSAGQTVALPTTDELAEWERNLASVYGNFQDIAAEIREMRENPLGRYVVIALAVIAGILIIKAVL